MRFIKEPLAFAVICFALIQITIAQQSLSSSQAAQNNRFSSWRDVSPEGSVFSIRFPREPRYEQQPREGGVTLHKLTSNGRNATFGIVFYSVSPAQAREMQSRFREHDAANHQRQLGDRLLSQRTLAVGGYPALELSTEVPRYGFTRTRTVATDTHIYILTAWATRAERLRSAEVEYFLDSFALVNR